MSDAAVLSHAIMVRSYASRVRSMASLAPESSFGAATVDMIVARGMARNRPVDQETLDPE
jgi:hypothetical protein